MASNGFKKLMLGMEELGEMLNQGDEYFDTLYSSISKDELDKYRNGYMTEELNEALEDYKITYYLSTATAERRPETIEDVENDWKEETFAADSDYDALLYALELIDNGYDDTDFSTAEEIVQYFEEKDLGDGSAFVIKLEGPNGIIYDMGYDKQSYIDEFVSEDSYDDYDDDLDESLNEAIDPSKALEVKKNSDADVIFYGYQYKNEKPVELDPEEWSAEEYQNRKNRIVNDYNKLYADKPQANKYAKEHDFIFYALYNRKNEELNEAEQLSIFDNENMLQLSLPTPYDKIFEIIESDDSDYYNIGDIVDGKRILGHAEAKPQYKEFFPNIYAITSDTEYPIAVISDKSIYPLNIDTFMTLAKDIESSENNKILKHECEEIKMNEDMSVRAKLKALYPELDFGDEKNEALPLATLAASAIGSLIGKKLAEEVDDDMDFDLDESAEYNFMETLYNGTSKNESIWDDEEDDEFSDCEDDECIDEEDIEYDDEDVEWWNDTLDDETGDFIYEAAEELGLEDFWFEDNGYQGAHTPTDFGYTKDGINYEAKCDYEDTDVHSVEEAVALLKHLDWKEA